MEQSFNTTHNTQPFPSTHTHTPNTQKSLITRAWNHFFLHSKTHLHTHRTQTPQELLISTCLPLTVFSGGQHMHTHRLMHTHKHTTLNSRQLHPPTFHLSLLAALLPMTQHSTHLETHTLKRPVKDIGGSWSWQQFPSETP